MKKKLLVFHPTLAPYRVDFFNMLAENFDLTVIFLSKKNRNQNFNNEILFKNVKFKYEYLNHHIVILNRDINLGYYKVISKVKPDIVLSAEYGLSLLIPYLLKPFFNYKQYTMSDDNLDMLNQLNRIKKTIRYYFSKRLDGIILLSNEVKYWYEKKFCNKNNFEIFPIIRNEEVFRNDLEKSLILSNENLNKYNFANKKRFLYVGRLDQVKNLELLIKSFNKVATDNVILIIVGDGTEKEDLLNLKDTLANKDKIFFVGRYEGLELLSWYNLGNVFILPSTFEPFGAVVNEALLSGCFVVCSQFAGSSVLIDDTNGIIFNPHEKDILQQILKKLIETKSLFKENVSKINIRENKMTVFFDFYKNNIINFLTNED